MLVLTRKRRERIRIDCQGEVIWLQVVDIDRGKIRLGVEAPRDVSIQREELLTGSDLHPRTQRLRAEFQQMQANVPANRDTCQSLVRSVSKERVQADGEAERHG